MSTTLYVLSAFGAALLITDNILLRRALRNCCRHAAQLADQNYELLKMEQKLRPLIDPKLRKGPHRC